MSVRTHRNPFGSAALFELVVGFGAHHAECSGRALPENRIDPPLSGRPASSEGRDGQTLAGALVAVSLRTTLIAKGTMQS